MQQSMQKNRSKKPQNLTGNALKSTMYLQELMLTISKKQ